MKNLLFFALSILLVSIDAVGQVPNTMPPGAEEFYNKSMPLLSPPVKKIILQTAENITHRIINADSLSDALHKNPLLQGMSKNDIDGISVLIMVQASKNADRDLKKIVMAISHNTNNHNAVNEQNDSQNLQLQMIMNHKSVMAEEISYVMKKISGSQQNIIENLK
jgi:hypothetical protein